MGGLDQEPVPVDYDAYAKVERWWMGGHKEQIDEPSGDSGCNCGYGSSSAEVVLKLEGLTTSVWASVTSANHSFEYYAAKKVMYIGWI